MHAIKRALGRAAREWSEQASGRSEWLSPGSCSPEAEGLRPGGLELNSSLGRSTRCLRSGGRIRLVNVPHVGRDPAAAGGAGAHPSRRTAARGAVQATDGKTKPPADRVVARGTSDNAAQFGRYLLEITTGIPVSLAAPSILSLYNVDLALRDALVVAISQSGESTDTNLVLERAREQGALTIGITNEAESAMARLAEHVFLVRAGREKSVAATKTYTGPDADAVPAGVRAGRRDPHRGSGRLPERWRRRCRLEPEIDALSERYRFMDHAVVVGRGLNYANAFEFALKMMETCYVVAERFSSADFLHGPIALVEQNFPVFVRASGDDVAVDAARCWTSCAGCRAETWRSRIAGNREVDGVAARK